MKLLPLLFYLLIFEPKAEQIKNTAVITALYTHVSFENVCYLIQNVIFLLFSSWYWDWSHARDLWSHCRRWSAYVWQSMAEDCCSLLGAAITFHAIYNLLIAYGGAAQYIAYLLLRPILTAGN